MPYQIELNESYDKFEMNTRDTIVEMSRNMGIISKWKSYLVS
jgi:hypothetical protein